MAEGRRTILPLPRGEGRDEGEQGVSYPIVSLAEDCGKVPYLLVDDCRIGDRVRHLRANDFPEPLAQTVKGDPQSAGC